MPTLKLKSTHHLYYRQIAGESRKPCLVFLHEGLGCVSMWRDFPDRLCQLTGCPGLIYDRLGYGKSSPLFQSRTLHYLHEYALEELFAVLQELLPGKPYILIGHSDGGSISLIHASAQPVDLKAVITEAAHVFVEPETIAGVRGVYRAWGKGQMKGLRKYHGDKTEMVFSSWAETWLSSWFTSWNIEHLIHSINVPMLIIQGEDDLYGTSAQVEAIAAQSASTTRIKMIADCGHSPHQEQPEFVLQLMDDFLEKFGK